MRIVDRESAALRRGPAGCAYGVDAAFMPYTVGALAEMTCVLLRPVSLAW
jgi:hypothetical protein